MNVDARLKLLVLIAIFTIATIPSIAQETLGTEEKISRIKSDVDTLDKDVKRIFDMFGKFENIRFKGYFQPQYQHTQAESGFGSSPYNPDDIIKDRINLRRARIKFLYETDLVGLVVETDYNNKGFRITDAFVRVTDPWIKTFSLKMGSFNRPVYEVETSSSKRESPERSIITRLLYPGERDIGFSFVIKPKDWFQLDIATFNNTYRTMYLQWIPNFGKYPFYSVIRLKKDFLLGDDATLTGGVYTRLGKMTANTDKVILPENNINIIDSTTYRVGDGLSRTWYGVEAQFYWKFLTGVKIAASYIWGKNVDRPSEDGSVPLRMRDFNGYYIYFIKNIGKQWQAVVKYNYYDPNTAITDDRIVETNDLARGNLGVGINNFTFSNVRMTLWYDFFNRQTTEIFPDRPNTDMLTFRVQVKF